MKQDTPDWIKGIEEELSDEGRTGLLSKATAQIGLDHRALEAIDRNIGLRAGDTLLCETTCLDYAAHALEVGVKALWIVPPHLRFGDYSAEILDAFETKLREACGPKLDALLGFGNPYKGLTTSVPEAPFKLLITAEYDWNPLLDPLEWPLYNSFWVGMRNTEGATGAVVYQSPDELKGSLPLFLMRGAEGAYYSEGFVSSIELPGGHVVLSLGDSGETFHMEDLTDPDSTWTCDVAPTTLAVNDGCLVPSIIRTGVQVLEETTLDRLASKIGRGTTLSEKQLDIATGFGTADGQFPGFSDEFYHVTYGDGHAPSCGGYYAYPGDLYYIDGTCFQDGTIRPKVLRSMPEGQGRYIVDSRDNEVLLVSRSSKEVAVYRDIMKPTLIGNGVFVIRLGRGISMDYVACWMRGSVGRALLHNGGRLLTKGVLSNLPVPILDDELMEKAVLHEREIDERIFDLYQEIGSLRASNRFNPLAALRGEGHGHEEHKDE